jgi:halocyanin-like protein
MSNDLNRRTFIRSTAVVSGVGLLAGCGGSSGDGGSGGGSGDGGSSSGGSGDGDADGSSGDGGSSDGGSGGEVPAEVSEYLSNVGNFDGSVVDETGSSSVEVMVGAEGNGGNYAFAPAAVRVGTGTTVTWTWTGQGAGHNVVDEGGAFESETVTEEGHEFTHTFESSGVYQYYCLPHKGLGMKGAIVVE